MTSWVETSIPGIKVLQPSEEKPLLAASSDELKALGFLKRPDPISQPKEFARWHRLARSNWITPELTETQYKHGPVLRSENVTSNNSIWSGIVIEFTGNPIAAHNSGGRIYADFVIPSALPPNTAPETHCSIWVGLDGYGTPDVLQAGIHIIDSANVMSYFWIEWFPAFEVRVGLGANPGESVGVIVDYEPSTNSGYAYLTNNTTNQTAGFNMTPPDGTHLVGSCLEWIVERPGINGATSTLMPYNAFSMTGCDANVPILPGVQFPGQAPNGTITTLSMTNNAGQVISQAALGPPSLFNGKQLFDNIAFAYNRIYSAS